MSPIYQDHFRTISGNHCSTIFLHFARDTFQFSAQGLAARKVSVDMKAVSGRTFQGLVGTRAVLARVTKKHPKNWLEGLNVLLVAQAAQVASAQPERVRSTLLDMGQSWNVRCIITASLTCAKNMKMMMFCGWQKRLVRAFSVSEWAQNCCVSLLRMWAICL